MASELDTVVGFHKVNNVKARELLQPHIQTDGYYLLRPSSDNKGGVLCTICVTNKSKLMNYRLVQDPYGRGYFIHNHTTFPAIHLLLAHYKTTPINVEANTRLLYPVGVPRQENPSPDPEDAYVIMEKQPQPMSPSSSTTDIPGLHNFLPKSEINTIMGPYIGTNGYYLLRPSSTSEGQLTLAVSHSRQVRNFKINLEKGQYFISPKKRFHSVKDLVVHYQSHPIRSKKAGNEKILLLYPIPVDQEREKIYQEIQQQKAVAKQQANALAPGWTEHWHNTYNRAYYYNAETGQSLWEKPLATPPKQAAPPLPDKNPPTNRPRMKDRPLPSVPGGGSEGGGDVQVNTGRRASKKYSRPQQPLPPTPSYSSNTLPARKISERELPPLPPKDDSNIGRRGLPPLPPKEESGGVRGEAHAPGMMNRPPIPIPGQGGREAPQKSKSLPPLPPKEDKPLKQLPPAPVKPSLQNGHPPLPPKEEKRAFPPLPPKVDEPTPLPAHLQTSEVKKPRKRIVEYEDIVPKHQADTKMASKNKAPPPLPEKDTSPIAGGGPPPPPPPPAIGAPPPPPLPPAAPPSPNPQASLTAKQRSTTIAAPSPQSSPGSGRPFTACDLASQRNLLKKRASSESEEPKKEMLTGMASIFASAIDTRRKAMEDSESESDFDDVEDDDDWD